MRKYPLLIAVVLLAVILYGQTFTAQPTSAQISNGTITANRIAFKHKRVSSEKAGNMRENFKKNGKRDKHEFTKFDRAELIAALQAMPEMDTVKFIIGAFIEEDGPGREKGKPVIMLQVLNNGKQIPGDGAERFMYMQGAICPPPNGVCALEQ